jgi:hypothetical protein
MKRMAVVTLLCLGAFAASAGAAPITFQAVLTGPNEAPPNASPGTGTALVTIDDAAHTLEIFIEFEDLVGSTTASHIHVINGPGDANTLDTLGPVATQTPSFIGFPLGVSAGTFQNTYDTLATASYRAGFVTDAGGTAALAEAALFAGILEGRAYVNIHSSVFGGGEIRGFLQPVPEPLSVVLLGIGVAGYALRTRRRRA